MLFLVFGRDLRVGSVVGKLYMVDGFRFTFWLEVSCCYEEGGVY